MVLGIAQRALLHHIHSYNHRCSYRLAALSVALRIVVTRGWTAGHIFGATPSHTTNLAISRSHGSHALDAHALKHRALAAVLIQKTRYAHASSSGKHGITIDGEHRYNSCGISQGSFHHSRAKTLKCKMTTSPIDASKTEAGSRGGGEKRAAPKKGISKASYGSGGGKMLRLSKLLADRAIGTRTEVGAGAPTVKSRTLTIHYSYGV